MAESRLLDSLTGRSCALIIPVKSFSAAKQRLSSVLSSTERDALSKRLLAELIVRNRSLNPMIVSDDETVGGWATDHEVAFLSETQPGLNRAVTAARDELRRRGVRVAVVTHADLARPSALTWILDWAPQESIIIVPDRHGDGTNVIALPTDLDFEFSYGPGSFARHHRTASASGLPVCVTADRWVGVDLDVPADLRLALPLQTHERS